MKNVYVISDNIISSLGFTTTENLESVSEGITGIRTHHDMLLSPLPVSASLVDNRITEEKFSEVLEKYKKNTQPSDFTRLEKMLILSVDDAVDGLGLSFADEKVLLALSTTKGNVDLLETRYAGLFDHKRIYLWSLAKVVRDFFGFACDPLIVSNACISGVMALTLASRMMRTGKYHTAVVTGGDLATEFVISGFQSFQALSAEPCKPFDLHRTGLSLGEGCGTMVLSTRNEKDVSEGILVRAGSFSNDANHISGPSRTGEELSLAMVQAMKESGISNRDLDFISAHGTATPFNDEMESKAIALSGLNDVHVNSFKGYWGHTLGAAGIMEAAALLGSMRNNRIYRSAGFEIPGVPEQINVVKENTDKAVNNCLKTASGFGGCNAALVFSKC